MRITITIDLPASIALNNAAAAAEAGVAAERACRALEQAISEPRNSTHRCDITNALNYLETIARQTQELGR